MIPTPAERARFYRGLNEALAILEGPWTHPEARALTDAWLVEREHGTPPAAPCDLLTGIG